MCVLGGWGRGGICHRGHKTSWCRLSSLCSSLCVFGGSNQVARLHGKWLSLLMCFAHVHTDLKGSVPASSPLQLTLPHRLPHPALWSWLLSESRARGLTFPLVFLSYGMFSLPTVFPTTCELVVLRLRDRRTPPEPVRPRKNASFEAPVWNP